MSIAYANGTNVFAEWDCSTQTLAIEGFRDLMERAGWTLKQSMAARTTLTFSGLPGNGQGTTIEGLAYKFVTTVTNANPRELRIGATASECAAILLHAINDDGAGKGTDYSSATTAHPSLVAQYPPGYTDQVQVMKKVAAVEAFTFRLGWDNVGGDYNYGSVLASWGGGYLLESAATPEGLRCALWLYLTGSTGSINGSYVYFRVVPTTIDFDVRAIPYGSIVPAVGLRMKVLANRYFFWLHQFNVKADFPFGGVLSLCPQLAAPTVTAATCTAPIQITTEVPHGLANGMQTFIDNAQGNTAANGLWFVTVVDDHSYTLNDSNGSGFPDYVENSARAANTNRQLSRCIIWHCLGYVSASPRSGSPVYNSTSVNYLNGYLILNPYGAGTVVGGLELYDAAYKNHFWRGLRACISEPLVWSNGCAALGGTVEWIGQLYDAVLVNRNHTLEVQATFDDHQWVCFAAFGQDSLWLVIPNPS